MKYILFALCVIWLSFSSASWAKTIYVTDSLQITMRILPDNNAKIIRMLPAAEALELLEKNEEGWLRVRNGQKEGWVLERLTTEQVPKSLQLARLEKKYTVLVEKNKDLPALVSENERLRMSHEQALKKVNELTAQYEKLRRDAADTVGLNGQIELLKKENKDSVEALEKIKLEYSLLESEVMLHWFLAGAGVFFLAWGLGFALGRVQRKRKTRLY